MTDFKNILPGTPEFFALPIEEQEARIARVLDQASQVDRLYGALPDDLHGEWIGDNPIDQAEAQRKGFVIDEVYAPKHTIHGSNRQGDVVFMTMPKALKRMYDRKSDEQYHQIHGKKDSKTGKVTAQSEDVEFDRGANAQVGLPTWNESTAAEVSGEQIKSAIGGS